MRWKSREWMLIGVLLAVMTAIGAAQVATTQVADTIYLADGTVASGTVLISWPGFTTGTGEAIAAGSTSAAISTSGSLSVQLVPNAGSTPMGSYYTANFHLSDGSVNREYWVVPVSSTPVTVSAIETTVLPASVAMQTVTKSYVDTAIAAATSGHPLDSSPYVLKTGDTMTGPLDLPADPVSSTQAADKNYVDESVTGVASGLAQKVSTLPAATQTVAQPAGTQLQVNRLNGVESASQYVNGRGNNGIANALAGPDCASGCEVNAEQDYTNEPYTASSFNSQTHVKDERGGRQVDSYKNPLDVVGHGISTAQAIDDVSTQSEASISQQTGGNEVPGSFALSISQEGLAGGSNLFPEQIETPPYFKMGYSALSITGTYNTQGQHVLVPEVTDCYGVGDCLIGSHFIYASGGFRDSADEGAHPFDLSTLEDSKVFVGTCASGCTTGSTTVVISPTSSGGTQGDGRFLIDTNSAKMITSASTGGSLIGGTTGGPHATAQFSGTTFPVSALLSTGQTIPSRSNNMAPGTVTFSIATTGTPPGYATSTAVIGSSTGLACVTDQTAGYAPDNFEMAPYTVIDATHLQITFNKPHQILATVAIGGLCGYGLEQTVDTTAGIRQLFPVVGAYSPTELYYAGGSTAVVGQMGQTSGFLNMSASIASVTRAGNAVTVTTTGNLSANVNGLTVAVAGVADSSFNGNYVATTIAQNSFTYSQSGPNSSSTGGTVSVLTGGFAFYPMAEVLSVYDQATNSIDGQMTLAPNNVPWAASDPVEQPHFYQERVAADLEAVGQTVPRPTTLVKAGIQYQGNNGPGLIGWSIENSAPTQNYLGYGGTHQAPDGAFQSLGVWRRTMNLAAGEQAVFAIHCNLHGCGNWNSGYNLFELDSNVGADLVAYSPTASTLTAIMRGTPYTFSPTAFTAGTINAGTLNATSITGALSAASITSGTIGAAYLPLFGPSGSSHGQGAVPDPGATTGNTRFLREDGTWAAPSGGGSGSVTITGGTIDNTVIGGATPARISATQLNGLPVGEYGNVPRKPLTTLLQALHNASNQAVNIVVLSDSFGVCDYTNCGVGPTTSSNRYTEQLRINLQAQYGSHGTGMVPLVGVVGPTLNSEEWAISGTWGTTNTMGPYQAASLAGSSLVHLSNGAVATFTSAIPYDTINTYCMTTAASGSIAVAIDGISVGTACGSTTSTATAHVVTSTAASLGTHTATFTSTGDSYIYAGEGTAGTTGVSVHNLSVGSAAAEWFGLAPSTQLAFSDLIPTGTQGVLTMLQTNEPGVGYSVSSFTSAMNAIIAHEQALSTTSPPSVMMVVPPQDVISGLAPYSAAQVAISQSQNVAFLNIQDRWGSTYVASSGLWDLGTVAPGIHPNDKGARDEYSMIYAELVDSVPFGAGSGLGGCSTNCTVSGTGSSPALTLSGTFRNIFTGTSSDAQGAYLTLGGSGAGVDTWGIQSAGAAAGSNAAHSFLVGDFTSGIYSWASTASSTGAGYNEFPSLNVHCWSSGLSVTTTSCDTGISRLGAGSVALGNGSQGDTSGSLSLATVAGNAGALGLSAAVTINGGSAAAPLVTTTSNASGNIFQLQGTASGVHTWGFQSDNYGHWDVGDFTTGFYGFELQVGSGGSGFMGINNSAVLGWMPSFVTPGTATPDTGLSRTAADAVACGNGTQGDASCTFKAALYQGPATAPSGSCSTVGWAFSQDGHATFCNGSIWVTKL